MPPDLRLSVKSPTEFRSICSGDFYLLRSNQWPNNTTIVDVHVKTARFDNRLSSVTYTTHLRLVYDKVAIMIIYDWRRTILFLTNTHTRHNNIRARLYTGFKRHNFFFFFQHWGRPWSRNQLNSSRWQPKRIDDHILSVTVFFFYVFFINRWRRSPKNNNKSLDGKLTWAFLLASFPSSVGNPKEALNHTRNHHRANIKTTFFIDSNISVTILLFCISRIISNVLHFVYKQKSVLNLYNLKE